MKIETLLRWPRGWLKTKFKKRFTSWSSYNVAVKHLEKVMNKLYARDVILTYNKDSCEVVIYFNIDGVPLCLANDKWNRKEDNIFSICLFLENLIRGSTFVNEQIIMFCISNLKEMQEHIKKETANKTWYEILGLNKNSTKQEIKKQYHILCKTTHPDNGGSEEEFIIIKKAYDEGIMYAG
jgi:hypothetical protein